MLVMAILTALFDRPVSAADTKALNSEWLRSDIALAQKTKSALGTDNARNADLSAFLKRLGPSKEPEARDLGSGIKQLSFPLPGGYSSIWFSVAAIDKKIVALECTELISRDWWDQVAPEIQKAWGSTALKRSKNGFEVASYIDKALVNKISEREFGAVKTSAIPADLQSSFDTLTSPLERMDVGSSCYIDGGQPRGKEAIEVLKKANRLDLIRAVLRSCNPEARTYAALALLELKKAAPDDLAVIDKLKKSTMQINVCHGCIVSSQTFADLLREQQGGSSGKRKPETFRSF